MKEICFIISSKNSDGNQNFKVNPSTTAIEDNAKWWETADDHRFALEVLQLKLRRDILKFIRQDPRTEEEIAEKFALDNRLAKYHLELLEKALVVERIESFCRLTAIGILYLNNVENRR
jgi:predicted HTH transcriptional regulator